MAMESVLSNLETRIEELVTAYSGAKNRASELETKVDELEFKNEELREKLSGSAATGERVAELEGQRDELATRLEKVLGLIDGVLDPTED